MTFVHCGQTVGWIKMKLGTQVGLGPGHIVLDGHPAPPPPMGHSPPIFGPYMLQPNGWMDHDTTWYRGRPRPRRLCWMGTSSPSHKRGAEPPQFSANFYCGQMAGWIKMVLGMVVGLSPGNFVLDQSPSPKRGQSPLPNFWPISIVAKRLDGSHGMEVGLSHGDFVSDGDPAPPLCFRPMLIIVIVIS